MRIDEGLYFVLSPYAYNSQNIRGCRCMVGWIYIYLCNQYLSPKVVSLNSAHNNVYYMQYYVVNLLMTWDCFLRLLQIKLTETICNATAIVLKKCIKHQVSNLKPSSDIPRIKSTWKIYRVSTIQLYYIHLRKHLIVLLFCIWFFTFIKMYTFEVFCFILFLDKFNILYLHF